MKKENAFFLKLTFTAIVVFFSLYGILSNIRDDINIFGRGYDSINGEYIILTINGMGNQVNQEFKYCNENNVGSFDCYKDEMFDCEDYGLRKVCQKFHKDTTANKEFIPNYQKNDFYRESPQYCYQEGERKICYDKPYFEVENKEQCPSSLTFIEGNKELNAISLCVIETQTDFSGRRIGNLISDSDMVLISKYGLEDNLYQNINFKIYANEFPLYKSFDCILKETHYELIDKSTSCEDIKKKLNSGEENGLMSKLFLECEYPIAYRGMKGYQVELAEKKQGDLAQHYMDRCLK